MKLLVHFDLQIKDELSRVKKFSHVRFAVEFFRDLNVHELDHFA